MRTTSVLVLLLFLLSLFVPDSALAYGGPGSVISGIGAFLAAVAAVLAAVLGFVWYPLKRLYIRLFSEEAETADTAGE